MVPQELQSLNEYLFGSLQLWGGGVHGLVLSALMLPFRNFKLKKKNFDINMNKEKSLGRDRDQQA